MTRSLPLGLGTLLAGKYRIDAVLGTGGMGTVFAAENIDLGRAVAIKVLHDELAQDPDLARRLRQEARAAAAIGHPGIVDVLDLGTTDAGAPFIVMERLEGEALGARLEHRQRLAPSIAVGIILKAVEALAAAHDKGIIHRDLKPDNIFLTLQPSVKLVDFGISKQITSDLTVTTSGVVMGTPLYMSPEQARGARDVTPATDLYSIGVILYQALCGATPHVAHNYNEMLAKILTLEPVHLATVAPELPSELTDLVHELLSKELEARPTAHETASRLRMIARLLESSSVAFSPTLQPDNVSDDELGLAGDPARTRAPSDPLPRRPVALEETVASMSARDPAARLFGETVVSMPPHVPSSTLRGVAAPSSEAASPTAEIATPTPRRGALAVLGVLAFVLSVALIAVVMRRTGEVRTAAVPDATRAVTNPDAQVVGDAGPALDAASTHVDAGTRVAPPDADPRRDSVREAPEPRRDAGVIPVGRDRGAALNPGAATVTPPDAGQPRVPADAGGGSDGLEIDETNPLKR